MSHKQVEQHRRQKAKQYFDELRCLVPNGRDPKNDRNKVLSLAIDHMQNLKAGKVTDSQSSTSSTTSDGNPDLIFTMDADDMPTSKTAESDSQPKAAESEADKRLSHNEVEQKRRKQARQHYDELRALLPNAAKYDKNTVLACTIQVMRQMSDISEQALAKMVSELSSEIDNADNTSVEKACDKSAVVWAACSLAQLQCDASNCFSESPTSVVSFAASLAQGVAGVGEEEKKLSRKRSSFNVGVVTVKKEEQAQAHGLAAVQETGETASGDAHEENERKRLRTLSPHEADATLARAMAAEQLAAHEKQEEDKEAFENEMDSLDALSRLAHCAAQLQVSQPSTPLMGPSKHAREKSWGETSIMNALPSMSLSSTPGSAGKGSFIAAAAALASTRLPSLASARLPTVVQAAAVKD